MQHELHQHGHPHCIVEPVMPMHAYLKIMGLALGIITLIIAGPLMTIWALNALFAALCIPYTFATWLAMLILNSALIYNRTSK